MKNIKIAIDSPAASGAGTQAKLISKHYNLLYLDTGKFYRILGKLYLSNKKKINFNLFKKKIYKTTIKDLSDKKLLNNKIGSSAAFLAKKKIIRNMVSKKQIEIANNPPKNFNGCCLDGRDITYKIMPNANVKFFMTANIQVRSLRRYKELKKLGYRISIREVYRSIKERDKNDYTRKISPLKKVKDAILINNSKLTIKQCFKKMKKIIDKKLKNNATN